MNKLLFLASALLLTSATAMPAHALDHGHGKDHQKHGEAGDKRGHDAREEGGRRSDGQSNDDGRDDRTDQERYGHEKHEHHDNRRYQAPRQYHTKIRYVQPRGYRYARWNVGAALPNGYYASPYYVDYRPYGLAPPPRGYHWVRVDRDVYLVETGNGLIRDILYGLFY